MVGKSWDETYSNHKAQFKAIIPSILSSQCELHTDGVSKSVFEKKCIPQVRYEWMKSRLKMFLQNGAITIWNATI